MVCYYAKGKLILTSYGVTNYYCATYSLTLLSLCQEFFHTFSLKVPLLRRWTLSIQLSTEMMANGFRKTIGKSLNALRVKLLLPVYSLNSGYICDPYTTRLSA